MKAAVSKTVVPQSRDRGFESPPFRQLEKEVAGSPSARARQPILGAKLNFLSFKIKFEPTFFPVLWQFAFPLPLFGKRGRKGVRSLPFRPPSPLIKSVRIFSNTHRQLVGVSLPYLELVLPKITNNTITLLPKI